MTMGTDRRSVLAGLGAVSVVGCAPGKIAPPPAPFDLSALEARHSGRIGLALRVGDQTLDYKSAERFLYCSSFKMFLAAGTLQRADRGLERIDRRIAVTASDPVGHSPVTETFVGREMTVEALCQATVEVSDNGAANILIREFGGLEAWGGWYRAIGDQTTRVDRMELELNRADGDKDTTTPAQTVANLQAVYRHGDQAVLSQDSLDRLDGWLVASPTGPGRIKGGVSADMTVAHKTGTSGRGHVIDIGMIRPRIGAPAFIAVYVEAPAASPDQREALIAEATRLALAAVDFPVAA